MALINCKECKKEISSSAITCPNCGINLKAENGIFKLLAFPFGIFFALVVYKTISEGKVSPFEEPSVKIEKEAASEIVEGVPQVEEALLEETAPNSAPAQVELAIINSWEYSEYVDDISGKPYKTAYVVSNNVHELDFPYEGETNASLIIRDQPKYGKEILFRVNQGQMTCQYDNCYINIRFDDGPVIKNNVGQPSDNSATVYFLSNYKKIIKNIKTSKKMFVEVVFYNQGSRTFDFNIADLDTDKLVLGK